MTSSTTKWNSSNLVKPLVKARKRARSLSPEEFCLLHAADFRYRLETEVLPALWQGKTVLADRFLFTALARDSARGLDLHWLLDVYYPLFWPDMVFYFAVSPETSGKRIAAERSPSYYESGQDVTQIDDPLVSYMRFISRVIREYEALAQIFQFVTVDAEQSIFDQHTPHPRFVPGKPAQAVEGPQPQSAHRVAGPSPGVRQGMSARNGNTRGRLIAVEGSGGRSMSVTAKCSEHEALAQIRSTPPRPRLVPWRTSASRGRTTTAKRSPSGWAIGRSSSRHERTQWKYAGTPDRRGGFGWTQHVGGRQAQRARSTGADLSVRDRGRRAIHLRSTPAGARQSMSARNGNTRGRLIAVEGSGGRSMSVAAKRIQRDMKRDKVECGISSWDGSAIFYQILNERAAWRRHRREP